MNIQEYIQSGVLELYAMGALPPEEMREVEGLASAHPEIRKEISAIELALGELATVVARAPRPGLKQEILGKIGSADAGESAPPMPPSAPAARILPMTPPVAGAARPARTYLMAASVFFGLIGIGLALYYGSRLGEAERQLAETVQQRDEVATQANEMREQLRKVETSMVVLRDPEYRTVMMKGTENAPGAEAIVHWHPTSRQVFLDVKNMPAPPSGHQYQLWALTEAGPVDAGMFDAAAGTTGIEMRPMKQIESASSFAVTIEPMGGSAAPTLEKMVAASKSI